MGVITGPGSIGAIPGSTELFSSSARTSTSSSPAVTVPPLTGGIIVDIDTSAAGSSPSTIFTVEGFDPSSKTWHTLLASVAVVATGHITLNVHPAITPVTNISASACIPPQVRVTATHGNATTHTYTVALTATS